MIDSAFKQYDNLEGLIFHSDQGWQYQMKQYNMWLKAKGIQQSFSRKGNCMDNSLMENFFGILKNEMFYGEKWDKISVEEFISIINQYMQWYRDKRIKLSLGGLSPMEYRRSLGIA